ncbi:MAG: hypothetical protein GYA33_01450, partial [Thermogutta sp.]|nr:hypothetical protein [Thermogutta sp.]
PLTEGNQGREGAAVSPDSAHGVPLAEKPAPKAPTAAEDVHAAPPRSGHVLPPSPGGAAPPSSLEAPPIARSTPAAAASEEDDEDRGSELGNAGATWLSPAESKVRRILLIVSCGVVAAGIVAGLWIFRGTTTKPEPPGSVAEETVAPSPSPPPGAVDPHLAEASSSGGPPTPAVPGDVLAAWLPRDAVFVIGGGDEFRRSLAQTAWLFAPLLPYSADAIVGDAMKSLGILPEAVARFALGVGPAGPPQAVVLFELREDQSTAPLESLGPAADMAIRGRKTIVLQGNGKNQLMIVVDDKTVAVGDGDYLRSGIAALDGPAGANRGLIGELGKEPRRWFAGIDLEHWRSKDPRFPNWVFDRLPEAAPHWRRLLDAASACSIEMQITEQGPRLACRWRFRNDDDTDGGLESLNALTAAARQWVAQRIEAVRTAAQSGTLAGEQARRAEAFLSSLQSLLDRAASEKSNEGGVLTILLDKESHDWTAAATEVRSLLESEWLQLGVALWRLRGETLGTGLQGVVKAEGLFPSPAAGGSLLPPETRLSWLASTLPYFGYDDWYARLNPGYGWRAPQNQAVTARELREVINPLLGPTQTREGFFDSHWVGVTGIGEDAAELDPNDPRAGLFNYNRRRGLQDLERGAANTLAVLGASARLGAWAEGGFATARPLTRQPYVNGPDGFGSGLPDGMLGMMADGSVRFIHRDIAPEVLERLAVVRGNGSATVADLFPAGTTPGAELGGSPTAPSGTDSAPPPPTAGGQAEGTAPAETPSFPAEQALATRLARVTMQEVPLGLVLHLLTQWSSIPVSVQPESLCAEDVSLRSPVSLSAENAALREIVQQIAEQTGLAVRIEPSGVVTLFSAHADLPETRVYRAGDYGGCFPFDENLAQLIRGLFGPSTENDAASDFEVVAVPEGLQIKCPPCTHREIETLLRRQLCGGGASANGRPPDRSPPNAGDSPVSATFLQATPL